MGDHDDGLAELVDRAAQEAEDLGAGARVEVAGRLVGEDDRRAGWPAPGRTATRCCWPPESSVGRCLSRSPQADGVDRPGRASRWSALRPAMSSGSVMFSAAVSVGSRLNDWKMKPIWSRRSSVSCLSFSAGDLGVADVDPARGDRVEPGQAVHQRGLAGARGAHDRGEAAARRCRRRRRPGRRPWSRPAPYALVTVAARGGNCRTFSAAPGRGNRHWPLSLSLPCVRVPRVRRVWRPGRRLYRVGAVVAAPSPAVRPACWSRRRRTMGKVSVLMVGLPPPPGRGAGDGLPTPPYDRMESPGARSSSAGTNRGQPKVGASP